MEETIGCLYDNRDVKRRLNYESGEAGAVV